MPTYVTIPQAKALILEHIGGSKIFQSGDVNIEGTEAIRRRPSASANVLRDSVASVPEVRQLVAGINANTNPAEATQAVIQNPVESFVNHITKTLPAQFRQAAHGSGNPSPVFERDQAAQAATNVFSVLTTGVAGNTSLIQHTDILVGREAQSNTATFTYKTLFEVDTEVDSIKKVVGDDGSAEAMTGSVRFLVDDRYEPLSNGPGSPRVPLGRVGGVDMYSLADMTAAAANWCRISGDGNVPAPTRQLARGWITQLANPVNELRRRTTQRNMILDDTEAQQTVANKMEVLGKVASIVEQQTQQGSTSLLANQSVSKRLLTPAAETVASVARQKFAQEEAVREAANAATASPEITAAAGFEYVNGAPAPRWADGTLVGSLPPLPEPE